MMEDDYDRKYMQVNAVPENMVGLGEYSFRFLFTKNLAFFREVPDRY